jgi:nucleoside-diphosphate-sugar epimerase
MSKLVIGCGYLGLRVARRFREAGEEVFVTSRKPERLVEFAALGLRPVLYDVLQPGPLPQADAVVYCVGFDRAAGATMRRVYVEGLDGVLERLPGGPAPRFVHVSSTSVYGQPDGSVVDESAETEPPDESGQVVLEAERVLRQRRPEAIVLRFAGIYGPGRLMRAASLRAGEPIAADPEKWLNLIHVEDGASVVVAAAARARAGETYNVSDGRPVRRRDFYALLAELLGASAPRFVPPGEPAPRHELSDRRVSNSRLREALSVQFRYPDYESGMRASLGTG